MRHPPFQNLDVELIFYALCMSMPLFGASGPLALSLLRRRGFPICLRAEAPLARVNDHATLTASIDCAACLRALASIANGIDEQKRRRLGALGSSGPHDGADNRV